MSEEVKQDKPKGPIGKLKDKIEDADEQLAVLSTLVRLGILIWSGGILTLNYVTIPGLPQQKIDPTFMILRLHWRFPYVRCPDSEEVWRWYNENEWC